MKTFLLILGIIASVLSIFANIIKISEWWRQFAFTARAINLSTVGERVNQVMRGLTIAQAGLMLITLVIAINIHWQQVYNPHMEAQFLIKEVCASLTAIIAAIGLISLYTMCNWRLANSSW